MWLINTQNLKLEELVDPSSLKYAILSHTWGNDEVSFQDISNLELAKQKAGFWKIAKTCELARQRGIEYAWVDTCCIDKSSSAELSEAINSMFAWYKLSAVCFVFLSDLPPLDELTRLRNSGSKFFYDQEVFGKCRWFTRGWTLQELIAPDHVEFYNSEWETFAQKSDCTLILAEITGISHLVLESSSNLHQAPVAVKMSWAARRETKRIEDRAYSLLGIFDINMPMIYGEGHKAFRRLQEEIAKETNDLSLFAWRAPENKEPQEEQKQFFRGIFADSPLNFGTCSEIHKSRASLEDQREFSVTNKGVRIETKVHQDSYGGYFVYLGFFKRDNTPVCINLVRTVNGFVRSNPWSLSYAETTVPPEVTQGVSTIYIKKDVTKQEELDISGRMHRSFRFHYHLPQYLKVENLELKPEHLWEKAMFHPIFISGAPDRSFAATLDITICGSNREYNEIFPLRLSLGWCSSQRQPFAVLHSRRRPGDKAVWLVRSTHRATFPDLTQSELNWGHAPEEAFEHALSSICNSQNQEVRFFERSSGPRLNWEVSPRVASFDIKLETHSIGDGITGYRVILSGKIDGNVIVHTLS